MLYSFRNRSPKIGNETYVSEHALVIGDVKIGDNCYIGHGAILRGDYGSIEIGSGTAVEEGVVIHAPPNQNCRIGERVTIGHGAIIHCRSIGDACLIGMGAILSIHSEIGTGATVAEGSVVTMRQIISPDVVVAGSPAKILRQVTEKSSRVNSFRNKEYENLAREYLRDGMQRIDPAGKPE
jgi:carbonic anhydrase/acetyltransferase-like protein (isoleucine patch superfamily)